jgi:hypothetical protein
MSEQIKCGFCHKYSDIKSVTRFPPYNWIHIDEHGCLCKYIQSLGDGEFNKLAVCVGGEILRPLAGVK